MEKRPNWPKPSRNSESSFDLLTTYHIRQGSKIQPVTLLINETFEKQSFGIIVFYKIFTLIFTFCTFNKMGWKICPQFHCPRFCCLILCLFWQLSRSVCHLNEQSLVETVCFNFVIRSNVLLPINFLFECDLRKSTKCHGSARKGALAADKNLKLVPSILIRFLAWNCLI